MIRGPVIDIEIPEKMNLATYYLDENLKQGRGKKVAVRYQDEKVTFSELCDLTNRLGNALKELALTGLAEPIVYKFLGS